MGDGEGYGDEEGCSITLRGTNLGKDDRRQKRERARQMRGERECKDGMSCTRDGYERENKEEKISGVFRGWSRVGTGNEDEERWSYI